MPQCVVADDSNVIRTLLRKILESINYEVIEASDGEELLAILDEKKVDLVISDWNLPIMDGIDVLYFIRDDKKKHQPKFVICSHFNDADMIDTAIRGGADDFIMRPFDEDIIFSKMKILSSGL